MPDARPGRPPIAGAVASFATPTELVACARRVRERGFTRFDAYSPYPLHGIDGAMGTRPTRLPWIVLGAGLLGLVAAIALQYWTNGVDYAFNVSGKPPFSLPAAIPVAFEVVILASALAAFFGMLALNGLPRWSNPILGSGGSARLTDDAFALAVFADDPLFDGDALRSLLGEAGGRDFRLLEQEPRRPVPRPLVYGAWILGSLALLPPAVIVAKRAGTSELPRIHPIQDMDFQPKRKAQTASSFFADGRASRPPVPGTVALGDLREDGALHEGRDENGWVDRNPVAVDRSLLERGRERYQIYCSVCHGSSGYGDGPVAVRADALREPNWVPPASLVAEHARGLSEGELFDIASNGVRSMAGYAAQTSVRDRWAIVAYLRVLQRSQNAGIADLPPGIEPELR